MHKQALYRILIEQIKNVSMRLGERWWCYRERLRSVPCVSEAMSKATASDMGPVARHA